MGEERPRDFGRDLLGLVLFGLGTVPAVMLVLWMRAADPESLRGFGPALARGLAGTVGPWPALIGSIGLALLGGAVFVSSSGFSPVKHGVGLVGLAFGLSLVLGGLSAGAGGAIGGGIAAALPSGWGGIATTILGAALVGATFWIVWLPGSDGFSRKGGELSPVAAAIRQEEWDGVSPAEAAALIPSAPRGVQPRSSKAGAETSAGTASARRAEARHAATVAKPLVQTDDGTSGQGAAAGAAVRERDPSRSERGAEPARAHLAAAGTTAPEREEPGREEPGREAVPEKRPLRRPLSEDPGVRAIEGGLRSAEPLHRPSWELADETAAEPEEELGAEIEAPEPEPEPRTAREPEAAVAAEETETAAEDAVEEAAPEELAEVEPAPARSRSFEQTSLFGEDEEDVEDLYAAIEEEDVASGELAGDEDVELADEEEDVEDDELDDGEDDEELWGDDEEGDEDDEDDEDDDEEEDYEDADGDEDDDEDDQEAAELADEDADESLAEEDLEEEEDPGEQGPLAEAAEREDDAPAAVERPEAPSEDPAELAAEVPAGEDRGELATSGAPEEDLVLQPAPARKTDRKGHAGSAAKKPEAKPAESPAAASLPEPRPGAVPPPTVSGPVLDERVHEAGELILERGRVAVSLLQRHFEIDFDEATAVLDQLQAHGLIGPYIGGRTREILLSAEEWAAKAPTAG